MGRKWLYRIDLGLSFNYSISPGFRGYQDISIVATERK